MAYMQHLLGWNPFASSTTYPMASNNFDQAVNSIHLPAQSLAFGDLQTAALNKQVNWWQPPTDSTDVTDDEDVIMEDWDNCDISEPDYNVMVIDSFDDDGGLDPTEMLPPFTPMNLDFDTTVICRDSTICTTIPGIPDCQVGFWGSGNTDFVMVDADDTLQTAPASPTYSMMPSTIPPPYSHGHRVLYALDVDSETDVDDDMLMSPTESEISY